MSSTDDLKNLIQIVQQLKGKRASDFVNAIAYILIVSILGLVGSLLISHLPFSLDGQVKIVQETLLVLFGVLFSLTFLILIILGIQKGYRYFRRLIWLSRDYTMFDPRVEEWNFQGLMGTDKQEGAIWLTDSFAGCFLKSREWRNCKITFQAKCIDKEGFGILFRVQDLEHYWMFKLNPGQNVADHFRTERGWQILHQLPQINFETNTWYNFQLVICDSLVKLEVNDFSMEYHLSDSVILNHPFFPINIADIKLDTNILTLPNNYRFGSVGFRASGGEKVYFRKLKVIRL